MTLYCRVPPEPTVNISSNHTEPSGLPSKQTALLFHFWRLSAATASLLASTPPVWFNNKMSQALIWDTTCLPFVKPHFFLKCCEEQSGQIKMPRTNIAEELLQIVQTRIPKLPPPIPDVKPKIKLQTFLLKFLLPAWLSRPDYVLL